MRVESLAAVCCALLVLCGGVSADFRIRSSHYGKFWANHHRSELSLRNRGIEIDKSALPPAQFYSQTLDHFDATNQGRFWQRYYVNDTFFAGAATGAPVFMLIQGEGSLSAVDAVKGEHVELAQEYGALILIVEHRYYGASVPVPDLSTPNMRFLSSEQALADLAEFYGFAQRALGLSSANPWIVFGGSYAGALTSWTRVKFGDLFFAAVSSSGPVQAVLNFEAYNDVVHNSLTNPLVGGSLQCASAVASAFQLVSEMAASGPSGLTSLSQLFQNCPSADLSDPLNYYQFISNLAGNLQNSVQYNNDVHPNVSEICSTLMGAGDVLSGLVAINNASMAAAGVTCVDNSWTDFLASLNNITVNKAQVGVGLRQWTYQTCAEFGYYQTCDPNTLCPFSAPQIDISSFTDLCQQLFGISVDETQKKINFTNLYYGAANPSGSRVTYVNGAVDPWHALSIINSPGNGLNAIFIPDSSHCANMDASRPDDTAPMKEARAAISAQIGQWIAEAKAMHTHH